MARGSKALSNSIRYVECRNLSKGIAQLCENKQDRLSTGLETDDSSGINAEIDC